MANIRRVHPGVYIKESLEAMEMTAKEFSARTGISERTLSSIINGNGDITFDVAYRLSLYFDNSITYWTNLQTQYNVYILEKDKEKEFIEECNLVKGVKNYLLDFKYISESDTKQDLILKCRQLVGVNSLTLLNKKDAFVCLKEQHTQKENDCFYQNFWLALALNEARKQNCLKYDKQKLKKSIGEIRSMTTKDPAVFYPRLKEIFNNCGISFVLLPYLSKSNIYGATKWFNKDSVMLAVSNRGKRADLFWFTLFHEISHVLMEHIRVTLISMEGSLDEEADKMATEMLISKEDWDIFMAYNKFTEDSIRDFANKIGIHPCIVLGRLHKENKVPQDKFNKVFNLNYDIFVN